MRSFFVNLFGKEPAEEPLETNRKSHLALAFKEGDIIHGEYEICKVLGAGGFGEVYLAYDRATESFCALKTIRSDKFADDILYEAFKREALLWVNLEQHPFILAAQGTEEFSGRLFVRMDYVAPDAGGRVSLLDHLAQAHWPIDTDRALTWAIEFCFGMEHAHQRGITCHRDIKPANILITQHGILKITDFGLALAADTAWKEKAGSLVTSKERGSFGLSLIQADGMRICGTPGYIAPELLLGKKADARSDIYSFGIVLWQMATGSPLPPFNVPNEENIDKYLREVFKQQMNRRAPSVGEPLEPIIARCLTPEPSARYGNFGDLRGELERIFLRRTGRLVELPKSEAQTEYFWNNKGNSLLSLDRDEEALECYEKAIEINPGDAFSWANKANALCDLRPLEAMGCASKALEINSGDAWAWRTMGNARLEQGRREMVSACGSVERIDPQSSVEWNNKGHAKVVSGRPLKAIACFDKALEIDPLDPVAWSSKGNALHAVGKPEEALACHDKALEINPQCALAWSNKSIVLIVLGRQEEGRACYDKALALDRRCALVASNKASALFAGGTLKILIYGDTPVANNKTSALFALGLFQESFGGKVTGNALFALQRFVEALACYEKAEEIEPPRIADLSNKGKTLEALGWVNEALACYDRILEIDPQYAVAWIRKGDALRDASRCEEAVACYDKALESNPRASRAWFGKFGALIELRKGNKDIIACFENYKKYCALDDIKLPRVPQSRSEIVD